MPLLLAAPEFAEDALTVLAAWGITRVSLDWRTPGGRDVLDVVEGFGWEVNLYGVPDLGSFLEAALLLPASVTADFNFPSGVTSDGGPPAPSRWPRASERSSPSAVGGAPAAARPTRGT